MRLRKGRASRNVNSHVRRKNSTLFLDDVGVFPLVRWLRQTVHTHNPVDDAVGNAEALLKMQEMGLRIG